jgi:hypothetical protein
MVIVNREKAGCLSVAAFSIIVIQDDLANTELGCDGRHGFHRGRRLGLDDVGID